jgi:PTH2 family peptidyl-tRNA hydrolase
MSDSIRLTLTLPVDPKTIYNAWLNSDEHTAFTKSKATIEKKVGSTFTAGDGYITGKNELLHMNKRIVQTWRTNGMKKIALKVGSKEELYKYIQQAKDLGLSTSVITDAGKTVVAPGTLTALGLGPAEEHLMDQVTGDLSML